MRAMMGDHHPFAPWLALVAVSAAVSMAFALWLCPRLPVAPSGSAGSLLATVKVTGKAARTPDALALAGGALVLWNVFSLLLGFVAPGASYLFTLVAIFAAGGFAHAAREPESPIHTSRGVALAVVPAALLWFPIVRVLLIMVAGTMAPAATLPIMLLASLFTPLLARALPRVRWSLPIAAAALALVATIVACVVR